MTNNQVRSLLVCFTFLAAAPASAAPVLMAEFETTATVFLRNPRPPFPPLTGPTEFEWRWGIGGAAWDQVIGAADEGQTFVASSALTTELANRLTSVAVDDLQWGWMLIDHVSLSHVEGDRGRWRTEVINAGSDNNYRTTIYTSPDAFPVVRWERTIADYIAEPFVVPGNGDHGWHFGGTQIIRIYGQAVPEPATWLLVVLGVLTIHCWAGTNGRR